MKDGLPLLRPELVAQEFAFTLQNLGGPCNAACDLRLVDELLLDVPRLPDLDFVPPTFTEFLAVLTHAKPSKAPGPDGLNLYVLSKLPERGLHLLFETVVALWQGKLQFPAHWLEASVFLLPKVSTPVAIEDYRPISLLNGLLKITACLANKRLQKWSELVLHPAQKGFRPGHVADTHILDALEIHATTSGYNLYVDYNKAFDSPIHDALFHVLHRYNVPDGFIQLVKSMYRLATSFPLIPGAPITTFRIKRGLRQGCPLSPTLFAFYLDPIIRRVSIRLSAIIPSSLCQ